MTPREDVIATIPGAWVWQALKLGSTMAELAQGMRVTVAELDIAVWRYRADRTNSAPPPPPQASPRRHSPDLPPPARPKASSPRRFSWQAPEQRA